MRQESDSDGTGSAVDAVLADYMGRIDRGEQLDQDAFIAAHPELAAELREYFSQAVAVEQFGAGATADFANQATPRGALEVRCPNCHVPMEVASDTSLTDLTCPACGSHFSLVNQNKATWMAPALTKLGRFELVERLGVGGFGSVWKARDKELDRTVAIKIPRAGGMTGEEQEKFFREARAAAQLRHPSIVSVHEVGRDGDSVYIVSDFVRGVTLGDWLTGQKLTSREAAELCAKIADALHHAHEQGVVHRDLKPANIMIDGDGQPHLMDFGLARREVGEVTITIDGQVMGTPAYMSPEQAQGESHTADRRSDVYSLGVILFQLLTGELPFRGNARMLMHQVIHDEPPSPRKLNSNVPKDLETITLKCLEKSPERRFQTAKQLADEFRRFTADEPIQARPITRVARTWRWAKRRPAAAALLALLVLAAPVFALAFIRERDLRFEVTAQTKEANHQAAAALAAKTTAEARTAETNAVLKFVENKVFAAARPQGQEGGLGHDVTLRQALESALPFVQGSFKKQPLIEARLRETLGTSFLYLGEPKIAVEQFKKAREIYVQQLGPDHPHTLALMNNLAAAYHAAGRLGEALPLFEQTLDAMRKKLGSDHPDTLSSVNNLAAAYHAAGRLTDALPLFEQTLDAMRKKLGPDHPDTLASMSGLANAYHAAGRLTDALPLFEQTLDAMRKKLGPDHPDTLASMSGLANAYHAAGRLTDARLLLEQTLDTTRKKLGPDHPHTLGSMYNLAAAYYRAGRLTDALPLFEQTLDARRKKLGPDHSDTLASMNGLANAYLDANRLADALPLFEQTLDARRKKLGPDDPQTLASLNNLANAYRDAGRLADALPLFEQTLDARRKKLGPDHPDTLTSMSNLARGYDHAGRLADALPLYEQTLDTMRKKLGPDHPQTLAWMNGLASAYHDTDRLADALPLYEQTLDARRKKLGADHRDTLTSMNNLANAYLDAGRMADALPLYEQTLDARRQKLGPDHPETLDSMSKLANVYRDAGRLADALPLYEQTLDARRKTLDARRKKLGADHPDTLASMNGLANAYLDADRLADALPLFEQTLDARRQKLGPDHPETLLSMKYLARAYYKAGRLTDALPLFEQTLDAMRKKLGPDHPDTLGAMNGLAIFYSLAGRLADALRLYEQTLDAQRKKLGPDHPDTLRTLNTIAWMLATSPIDKQRDGKRAVKLATEACELTAYEDPDMVETLAAACAETGDFESAVKWAQKSLELLGEKGDPALREEISLAMAQYKDKKPMRQEVPAATPDASTATQPNSPQQSP